MAWDGTERRATDRPTDVVYTLAKIEEKFLTLEKSIDSKLGHACEEIEELKQEKEKIVEKYQIEAGKKHDDLEKKIYQNFRIELTKILNKLEILVGGNETTQITLSRLDGRVCKAEDNIRALQDGPKQKVYETVISITKKIGWGLLLGLGAMIMYAIQNGFIDTLGNK